ncbi:dromaiocalcin-1-like [Aegotheles albertisi]
MGPADVLGLCLIGCLALRPCPHVAAQAQRCPRGWLAWGGHCYGYFVQELSWRQAEAWCRSPRGRGGHLASLQSSREQRALAAFITRRQQEEEEEEESVWVGLYRRGRSWLWSDGSPRRYSAWEGDETPVRGGRCAALEESAGFLFWEEESCGERNPFVCKHRA